jgi:hypothetical protein
MKPAIIVVLTVALCVIYAAGYMNKQELAAVPQWCKSEAKVKTF